MVTLSDCILEENYDRIVQILSHSDVNGIDEYGFTPLIESAIVNNTEIAKLLLQRGANPNLQDITGGTPLQWAAENNNLAFCELLLKSGADPNAYNFSGQPVLTMPTLRRQSKLRRLLIQHGADETFTQDYINTKLLGHLFELVGTASIIDPNNQFVEVDFEGFFLEVTLGLIANSLAQFQNHFAARDLRKYTGLSQFIVEILTRSSQLIKYQQYRIDIKQHEQKINTLLSEFPLLIPVAYEGHAITFIILDDIWIKCDRREDSRLYDNIMFYKIKNTKVLGKDLYKHLLYQKNPSEFINQELDQLLQLEPLTSLKVEAQISGNCSWANVEASIPSIFFLILMKYNANGNSVPHDKSLALNFFHRWREWNKNRALNFCLQSFSESDSVRKACKAEILAAILFQRCDPRNPLDQERIEKILGVLLKSSYEYLLKNYLRVYYYQSYSEEGKRFYDLLKSYGVI